MPPGIAHRLVALVNSTLIEKCSYHYYWKHGVLTRCSDILLFVSCEQDEYLEVSARATAEDDQDTSFVELLWSETFYILDLVTEFMNTTWSNIRTTVSRHLSVRYKDSRAVLHLICKLLWDASLYVDTTWNYNITFFWETELHVCVCGTIRIALHILGFYIQKWPVNVDQISSFTDEDSAHQRAGYPRKKAGKECIFLQYEEL